MSNKNIIIKEPYATEMRNGLWRYRTDNLNEYDKETIEYSKKILSKYSAIWN